jgi:hypothetical protein
MDTEEPVLLEPEGGVQNEEHRATSLQEGVSTDIATVEEKDHEEQAVEVEKTILEEPEAVKEAAPVPEPQLQEEKPQSSAVAETEAKSQENAAQHSTHAGTAQHACTGTACTQHAHSEREKNLRAGQTIEIINLWSWSCCLCQTLVLNSKTRVQLHSGAGNWWSCSSGVSFVELEPCQTRLFTTNESYASAACTPVPRPRRKTSGQCSQYGRAATNC